MTDDPFVTHRSLLFTVAYELLGSAADAEDVVQETWLRWDQVDQSEIEAPRAYLARIVTRQSRNRLRTVKRRLVAGITQAFVDAYGVRGEQVQVFIAEFDDEHWAKAGTLAVDRGA